jgi:hypothetical protein
MTNTLAYCRLVVITAVKVFTGLAPGNPLKSEIKKCRDFVISFIR